MDKIGLGDRMKQNYEGRQHFHLIRRMPVILRLDGRAFHTLTRGCDKPFDNMLANAMVQATIKLCGDVQGCKLAYIQSDEVSLLLTDYDELSTMAWFDYDLQKIVSISASIMAVHFSLTFGNAAEFDCRAFNVPKEEVANYFVWRQKDWIRNSVQMLAQAHFSHKQLHGKSQSDMHDMLHDKGKNWADLEDVWKNGCLIIREDGKWIKAVAPIFTTNRSIIEQFIFMEVDDEHTSH